MSLKPATRDATLKLQSWDWKRFNYSAPLLALLLLAALGVTTLSRPDAADAEPYHARVRAAAKEVPYRVGAWVGKRIEPLPEAQKLLRPNIMLSWQYENQETGETATFLLTHCKDARDMQGHYPPNCYPAQGYHEFDDPRHMEWQVNGVRIQGMEYRYALDRSYSTTRVVVDNFMIMPDGQFLYSMERVREAAADYTSHFYGAGQVQVVTQAGYSDERRREIFRQLVGAHLNVINTIRDGLNKDKGS